MTSHIPISSFDPLADDKKNFSDGSGRCVCVCVNMRDDVIHKLVDVITQKHSCCINSLVFRGTISFSMDVKSHLRTIVKVRTSV